MAKHELDDRKWDCRWDDDGLLGDFHLTCPCGKEVTKSMLDINEDKLKCECGRIFKVERTTKVIFEEN